MAERKLAPPSVSKKLRLNTETLRKLSPEEAGLVSGGKGSWQHKEASQLITFCGCEYITEWWTCADCLTPGC